VLGLPYLTKMTKVSTLTRIVGKDELDPKAGYISWVSPLARAMRGKAVGDVVQANTPKGEEKFEVVEIRY